jgi:demethylmenaquinone methyltransferase/2-methoxy-6-polyprenyl-1,4-benzoquinol methylase
MTGPEAHWFGDKPVDPSEKAGLVRGVFDRVARRYDLMNDLMSGGVHRLWKHEFLTQVAPRADEELLDVGGGTGDIAFGWRKRGGGPAVLCDINASMLSVGRDRGLEHGMVRGLTWVNGDAEKLPFPAARFDVYTIAFCLRNVTDIDAALREAARVLKPGGRFFCLEFSKVVVPPLARAYDAWSRLVIPALGQVVAKDRGSYEYLVESIRRFPDQETLCARIEAAGLSNARVRNLSGGIAAIHSAERP